MMKYVIISDIHGSSVAAKKAVARFEQSNAAFLCILGDVLYHGPRNSLPGGHDPKGVVTILNQYREVIIAVRGNCDAEVDQLLLNFPCMSDYALIVDEGRRLFLTHGHVYREGELPYALPPGSVLFSGHTHVWRLEEQGGLVCCNPGSISLPKPHTPGMPAVPTFAVYESAGGKTSITVQRLDDGGIVAEMRLPAPSIR
ncbi:MAG: phosphodiesterase [Spirochaetaceae bacterium]|jgi:putative phosphoesterase|nr:phosphodiesterase [Spirochaetaceae bacterium]